MAATAGFPPEVVAQLDALAQGIQDLTSTRYTCVAALTLWTYDTLLKLGDEIQYAWSGKVSWAQVLYFLNRYVSGAILFLGVGFFFQPIPTSSFCNVWPWFEIGTGMITVLLVQSVLMLRVIALYGRNRLVIFLIVASALGEVGSFLGIGVPMLLQMEFTLVQFPSLGLTACGPVKQLPSFGYTFWIVPLSFDLLLFGLVVYRALQDARRRRGLSGLTFPGSYLLKVLLRDSSMIFLYAFLVQLGFELLWRFARPSLYSTPYDIDTAIFSILATRLLLNLWSQYHARGETSTLIGSPSVVKTSPYLSYGAQHNSGPRREYDTLWAMQDDEEM